MRVGVVIALAFFACNNSLRRASVSLGEVCNLELECGVGLDCVEGRCALGSGEIAFTSPLSPSNANDLTIRGTAPAGTVVSLFTEPDCTGTAVGTGTADESGAFAIDVTVAD